MVCCSFGGHSTPQFLQCRLDKRVERARARHEVARPVMGTVFLVIIIINFKIFISLNSDEIFRALCTNIYKT